ncbi:MAG: hypothetical protein KDD65_06590 [Bacteroidetes bacterium]|nr:hypothetical protein [Bacteroidota bacterium]
MIRFSKAAVVAAFVVVLAGCSSRSGNQQLTATAIDGVSFRDIGPGNRQLELINAVVLDPEAGIDARIVQTTAQERNAIAVVFQPSTGETSYLRMPGADGARAISNIDGEIFIGTYLKGQVFHWNPGMDEPQGFDLPRPGKDRQEFVFSVDKGSDGYYYAGTWPEGDLMRLDLDSGAIDNLGAMTDDPPREYYLRHILPDFPGKLYLSYATEVAFKEYDLATGEATDILPAAYRDRQWVSHAARFRDLIVVLVDSPSTLLFIDPKSHKLVRAVDFSEGRIYQHNYRSLLPVDRFVYFGTIDDDKLFRYDFDNNRVEAVKEGIGHPIGLAADHYLFTVTRLGLYSVYDIESDSVVVQRQGDFEGDGMVVHTLAEGPDATIIGGSYINQGFFRYDPYGGSLFSPGRAVEFPGQIDNMVTAPDGRIFIGHYTKARFSVYDPSVAWNPGNEESSNPRIIGSAHETQDRVPDGVLGPDGRIYFGTKPEYGKVGGALVIVDPSTLELDVHRNVVQDQSVYALVSDGDRYVYASTSVRGGLGSREVAKESKLFKWDTREQRKVWEHTVVPNAYEIWGLDWADGQTLVGAADSVMFLYDVTTDSVTATRTVAPEEVKKVVTSSDGWIYAMTEQRLLRVSKDLADVQVIDVDEGYWDSMVEMAAGRLFVGRGERILEVVRRDAPTRE